MSNFNELDSLEQEIIKNPEDKVSNNSLEQLENNNQINQNNSIDSNQEKNSIQNQNNELASLEQINVENLEEKDSLEDEEQNKDSSDDGSQASDSLRPSEPLKIQKQLVTEEKRRVSNIKRAQDDQNAHRDNLKHENLEISPFTNQQNQKNKTFTEGQGKEDENLKELQKDLQENSSDFSSEKDNEKKIFAENLKISQNPAQIDIDNKKSNDSKQSDQKNLLENILNEEDSSSSSKSSSVSQEDKEKKDDDEISENERRRILEELNLSDDDEDEDDDEEEEDESNEKEEPISDGSLQDITNKSIDSGPSDLPNIVDQTNYLPFISHKYEFQNDVLETIDKNERSFKIVAEKMIYKSSQLDQQDTSLTQQRRLMHFKEFNNIAFRFHGDAAVSQGVPYSCAAIENFIAIGSSDGSVRLFDSLDETEFKPIVVKEMKQNPVFSLDLQRCKGNLSIYVVTGHSKGQICLYQVTGIIKGSTKYNMSFKHLKSVSDIHEDHVVQVKLFGEFRKESKEINVVSCDVKGTVYLSKFTENVLGTVCNKQCFWRKRLEGAPYSVKPLFYQMSKEQDNQIGAFNTASNPYQTNGFFVSGSDPLGQLVPGDSSLSEIRNHLIAFGALKRVILVQVAPKPMELFAIERPDYVDPGIVPYLDWGRGLSPVYRDTSYPILAIAWGRAVQLVVWTNFKDTGAKPELKFDGFYICDGFSIDQCFFLEESLIFVLINKKEVKILYTQRFSPGVFDEKILQTQNPKSNQGETEHIANKKYFLQIKEKFTGLVSNYAEVDKGYRLVQKEEIRHKDIILPDQNILRSKFNFNPTICKNFDGVVLALGKTSICQAKLILWEEYLNLIRQTNPDDWLKVLRVAIDIFNGKIIGLAGLPDQQEARQWQLREKMKDILKENIDACIQEFQEGQMVQSKTLRVATEFCIKIGAIDHLFGELFDMFAEAGIEQRYFENLEAFILSGKLKNTKIPNQILSRIIQYYRQKDAELLEKSVLNLNLNNYPQILELRQICEEEFCTSALIHILTIIYEKDRNMQHTVCLHILCALFSVMNKAKSDRSKNEVMGIVSYLQDSTILFEANQLPDKEVDQEQYDNLVQEKQKQQSLRSEKLQIERSKTYIGYKLMWVIQLFLEGKKFPLGNLSASKQQLQNDKQIWQMYVFDVVRFITTPQFLKWFLNFDPHRFFKLIQALYLDKEPYYFILTQKSFVEMNKDKMPGLETCLNHLEILDVIHKEVLQIIDEEKKLNNCESTKKSEILENSFMFFVTRIACKCNDIRFDTKLIQETIIKQLQFHRKIIKLDLNLEELTQNSKAVTVFKNQAQLTQAIQTQKFSQKIEIEQEKDKSQQLYKYLVKQNEKDVLELIRQIQDQVDEGILKVFCSEADNSPMFMVRIQVHQILSNYQKCLQMFFKIKVIKENVFGWLQEIQTNIWSHNDQEKTFEQMQNLILKNFASFIQMDVHKSIELSEQWFSSDYPQIVMAIDKYANSKNSATDLIFTFINTILEVHNKTIVDEYTKSTYYLTGEESIQNVVDTANKSENKKGTQKSQSKYKWLILELTKIICKKKYRKFAMEYVSRDYFPIDDCLSICQENGITDACAVLLRRKGELKASVSQYIEVLTRLSEDLVVTADCINQDIPFNDPSTKNSNIRRFDEIMTCVIEICDKEGSRRLQEDEAEELWLYSIEKIYQIKHEVNENLDRIDANDLNNFQIFLLIRIQAFMMRMAEYVSLEKIIDFLQKIGKQNIYQEFQPTFEEKVKKETYIENILNNTTDLVLRDFHSLSTNLLSQMILGCVAVQLECSYCRMPFTNRWDKQQIVMFKCGHNFHQRCASQKKGKCAKCFDEFHLIARTLRANHNLMLNSLKQQNKNLRNIGLRTLDGSKNQLILDSDSNSDDEQKGTKEILVISQRQEYNPESEKLRINQRVQIFEQNVLEKEMVYYHFI